MGRGSIDHLMEIGWIKPSGRKNIPGKPALWVTTELFMEHFGIEKISDLPNKDELKASGFLEKRSAIATITDIAGKNDLIEDQDIEEEETLDDFIGTEYSSKLSAFLSIGCLSPVMIYHEVKKYESKVIKNSSTYWLIFEILWREFFRYVYLKEKIKIFIKKGINGNIFNKNFKK